MFLISSLITNIFI